jgi:anionic cell wall polymer biosynthesis LytR-Cps2A-Psr (LCP) family protein
MENNLKEVEKLQDFLKLKKKQLVAVSLPIDIYIKLKKQSYEKQKTIQEIIRQKIENQLDDETINDYIQKSIEKFEKI